MKTLDILTELDLYFDTLDTDTKTGIKKLIETDYIGTQLDGAFRLVALYNRLKKEYKEKECEKTRGSGYSARCKKVEKILASRDNNPSLQKACTIDGKQYACFNGYYGFIFDSENKLELSEAEQPFDGIKKALEGIVETVYKTENKVTFDYSEIKLNFSAWKKQQKTLSKAQKQDNFLIEIDGSYYNADYFLKIVDVLGKDAELYQEKDILNGGVLVSQYGMAVLMKCRPPQNR